MCKHTFIDRYFHSQNELVDIRFSESRDINTLFTYLNNLHSTADKLKELFDSNVKDIPEFKLLRILRNYFHHVDDVDEIRMFVTVGKNVIVSHSTHIIIPLETFAKSVKSFMDNNTVPKDRKDFIRKSEFVNKEMASIMKCFDYCAELLNNMDACCKNPSLKLDGTIYELGFDMYKFVYNVSNYIADECRSIDVLANKDVVKELDDSYTASNNIGKYDVQCRAGSAPIMTTKGFIYPNTIEAAS